MTDLAQPAGELDPARRRAARRDRTRARRLIGGQQRVYRKDMLDVHQHQFLMLLLVVKAKLDERRRLAPHRIADRVGKPQHRGGDVIAIGADRIDCRARQEAALRPRVARSDRLVIGIEQIRESRVEDAIARIERSENKSFEKPAGMGQMPFCRADIGHRLDRLVFRRQVGGEHFAVPADRLEPVPLGLPLVGARRSLNGCVEHWVPPLEDHRRLTSSRPLCSPGGARRQSGDHIFRLRRSCKPSRSG